ncbi:hypothetical protein [Saccharibacillus endophyticus]|uniref:Uncharacterized protein n=1 Tax=Saccharibacillus endophyticus TaxID=2060666 RepID=A0ABQ2A1S2_9BACL|nr:hypothetical protein [Saccharibacillus endophyticus]GGH82786.1 hypothetical protein GCM10007362_34630 [Saccharibacillus endophyticus]
MKLTARKEASETKQNRGRGKARLVTALSIVILVIGYWIWSTMFIAEDAFIQASYRHMEVEERKALDGYPGLLEVQVERVGPNSVASIGGWQTFHRWLCWTNGGYAVRVTYPDLNPRFGNENKSLYFNPNTRAWIGYGWRM